ncbi:hypothetical protein GIB67_010249 [Kingdonia uniflora]|uniref:ATP-dependent DNA helicase n=1 Tax=Kingdonia uniflora TaxID=39325 RepID=A0A7J7NAI6_9MAGN|nr:hypothetical protein GIB67_010249 [Kingdonia uniflora]
MLAVTSPGIAVLLIPGGRTSHSRYKIRVNPDEGVNCKISQKSNLANLIRKCDLLTINMYLRDTQLDSSSLKSMSNFNKWVLHLGDGKLPTISINDDQESTWIKIPNEFLIAPNTDELSEIIPVIYPDLSSRMKEPNYLRDICILAPTK